MNQAEVMGLFPIPVLSFQVERSFTKEEKNFFALHSKKTFDNEGNVSSLNKYILNEVEMSTIKSEVQKAIDVYLNQIIIPENKLEIYVTQSWLNYTKENQYHHRHNHSNSFLSGVYYIDVDENSDQIHFSKEGYRQINVTPKEWTVWNSEEWWIPVKTGKIVVFPSNLVHKVAVKKGKNTRCSLAFNTFIKGKMGSYNSATELEI